MRPVYTTAPAPNVPLLDGVPAAVSLSWYQFFQGIAQSAGSVLPTAYTPTDQSGARLLFGAVVASYSRNGSFISVYGTLTWPTTVDTTPAAMSLPFPSAAPVPGMLLLSGQTGAAIVAVAGSATARFAGALGALTNADLSGKLLEFFLTYPAS